MGEQIIRISDLSGARIENPDEQLVSIVVTDHPDLEPDKQVRLEALPEEIKELGKLSIAAVGLQVTRPGEEAPTRHIITKANFDKLATIRPMDEVLAGAAPVNPAPAKRRSHNQTTAGEPLRTFDTLEHAGEPHKGKISTAEATLVRENLEAINKRLVAEGHHPIDPSDPEQAKRYGFEAAPQAAK